MEFERALRKRNAISLTSLIDVVFILIVFFMLSTTFSKSESLELLLPPKFGKAAGERKDSNVRIYLAENGDIFTGQELLQMDEEMLHLLIRESLGPAPDVKIFIYSAPGVPVQRIVSVMDEVYRAGGKSLSVSEWKTPPVTAPADTGGVP